MTRGAYKKIRSLIKEMLNEIDIEEVGQTCWAPGSTHDLKTCTVGDDKYFLKFSDPNLFGADDPSLQILNEYLAYRIFRLFPGVRIPGRVEPVYDRANQRVGLMTSPAAGQSGRSISRKQLAALLSTSVYASIFLAHWDISNTANVIVSPDGSAATLIDPGGTMDFRARGERKGTMFGDNPSELSSMISGPRSRTDIFDGADLRQAADEFLAVDWTNISSTIDDTLQEVSNELQKRGMDKLLSQWREYISHIAPILAKRHKQIVLHAEHILES
jgi:hypothetical protein